MTRKQEIFAAAAKLFQQRGYKAASMRDLAKAVGLQVSSLYSHLGSKEEVLQKMCFDNAYRFMEGMAHIQQQSQTPSEKIQALIRLHIQIAIDNPTSITVFNDEWRHLSQPALDEFLQLRRDYEIQFIDILKTGMEQGIFQKIDPTIAFYTLLASLRWIHYGGYDAKRISKEQLEEEVLRLLMQGLQS